MTKKLGYLLKYDENAEKYGNTMENTKILKYVSILNQLHA
jgi:hypothetical protein